MSISFSVHELNQHMQKLPIYLVGILWMDPQGVWLLDHNDVPTVEIIDAEACQQLRTKLAPAKDYLCECLIFAWLTGQAKQWALERVYWISLRELNASIGDWPVNIQVCQVPPEYDYGR